MTSPARRGDKPLGTITTPNDWSAVLSVRQMGGGTLRQTIKSSNGVYSDSLTPEQQHPVDAGAHYAREAFAPRCVALLIDVLDARRAGRSLLG